jgi:hypothetical protein
VLFHHLCVLRVARTFVFRLDVFNAQFLGAVTSIKLRLHWTGPFYLIDYIRLNLAYLIDFEFIS